MRKWIAGLVAVLGLGAYAVASAKDVTITDAVQADTVTFAASWKAASSQIAGCPLYRVTWTVAGVPTAGKTVTVLTDTLRVTRASGAAQTTASVAVVAVCGSKSSAVRTASRTVTWPVVTVPVDSTPGAVDSLRVDTVATGGPIIVPPDTTPTPVPTGDFVVASHMPSTGMQPWFDDDLDNMAQDEFPNANRIRWGFRNNGDWRVRDATTPYSDGALRIPFPANGYGDGYGVGLILREEGCWPRMYTVAMEKFEGSGGQPYKVHFNEEKTVFPRTIVCADNSEDNSGPDIAYVSRNNRIEIQLQNGLGSPRRYQNFPVWYTTEKWHKVEHYMQANTPGKQDGIWRMWIDGVLAADFNDILYSNNSRQVGFQGVRWETVRGGGRDNAPIPPGGQTRTYDRLAVYVSPTVR